MKKISNKNNKHIFVGVAWPYVNGDLHPGHLGGYLLPADIFSRYHRMRGNSVLMVSGSDCHGTPITIESDKLGKSPAEIVEKYHRRDVDLFKLYNLDYNLYTKTTTENHKKIVQDIFLSLLKKGYISKGIMRQYYSPQATKFLPDRYVEGECPYCHSKEQRSDQCEACGRWLKEGEIINPKDKAFGGKVILKNTEHYFLNLNKLEKDIEKYVKSCKDIWKRWVYSEALGWIREGLKKRAITRDLDWGIDLPINEINSLSKSKQINNITSKKIYVWFEAVIGYLSASIEWSTINASSKEYIFKKQQKQSSDWKKWWLNKEAEHYYFMGQDNLVFHTIMWPGQLIGLGKNYTLPKNVVVNKFVNYERKKFSKSKNWTVDSTKLAKDYGADEVRFYIASILPENKTSNFSWDDLRKTINSELVAIIGNFINRTLKFLENKFNGKMGFENYTPSKEVVNIIKKTYEQQGQAIESCQFGKGLKAILELAKFGNRYVDSAKIWEIDREQITQQETNVILDILNMIYNLSYLMYPYMPNASYTLQNQLCDSFSAKINKDLWNFKFKKHFQTKNGIKPLFRKIK